MSLVPAGAGGAGGDIIWGAYIEDHTGEFWNRQAQYLNMLNIQINNYTMNFINSFNRFGSATGSAIMGIRGIIHTASHLAHILSRVFGPAIRAVEDFTQESIDLAANANMLGTVLEFVGQNAGYSTEELDQMVQTMNEQGITIRGSRQILLEMIQTNLDLATATELAARAQDVGRVAMVNSTEAAQRMIHAIATLNPLVLRRMGIIVDFEQAYRDYARSIDVAWESLTMEQKQLVATQEVLRATETLVGAYGASLDQVGGQVLSLDRLMEDLQVTLGQVFQPAYTVLIREYSDALIDARDALESHEDLIDSVAIRLEGWAETVVQLMKLLGLLVRTLADVAAAIGGPESVFGQLQDLFNVQQMEGEAASVAAIIGARILTTVYAVVGGIDIMVKAAEAGLVRLRETAAHPLRALFDPGWQDYIQSLSEIQDFEKSFLQFMGQLPHFYLDTLSSLNMLITGTDVFGKETEEAGRKVQDTMSRIGDATQDAIDSIEEFNKSIAEDFAERALEIEREDFEENIRLFRQLVDANRGYMRRLEDIRIQHARRREDLLEDLAEDEQDLAEEQEEDRLDLEEEYAEKRLEVERDYIRELEDIQRHYIEDVEEAARQNDAVAVARLMRQRARDRRDARIERERELEDLQRDYDKELAELREFQKERLQEIREDAKDRLAELQEMLDEQLEDAERARQRELDDLELYNKRRQDDIARQRQWELEDLRTKHQDEIDKLAQHLSDLEGMHESHLRFLLDIYADYYADEIAARTQYFQSKVSTFQELPYYGGMYDVPISAAPTGAGTFTSTPAIQQPTLPQQPIYSPEVSRYQQYLPTGPSIPSNIQELCRRNPNDPICAWYGLDRGGLFITEEPTHFISSLERQPEMIAAIPLSGSIDHNINVGGRLRVDGVSPGMERDMSGELLSIIQQIGEQLLASA